MDITIASYCDENNNTIESLNKFPNVKVIFQGKNNRLILSNDTWFSKGIIKFTGSNSVVNIGKNSKKKPHSVNIRVGEDSKILIGNGVTIEKNAAFFACEGASITIGDDCMISTNVQFRADDSHPIFNINTDKRVNFSRNITVANHCWIGFGVVVLKGCNIGRGSVIGIGSIVTKNIPNNCIAVGMPARVVKKDIAWERPNLATTLPAYKICANDVLSKKKYWATTEREFDEILCEDFNNNKWPLIVEKCKSCNDKLNDQSKFYYANALFHEGEYKLALKILLSVDVEKINFDSRKIIGKIVANLYFKQKLYYLASKNSLKYLLNNPFDKSAFIIYIVSSILSGECVSRSLVNNISLLNGSVWIDGCKEQIFVYLNNKFNGNLNLELEKLFQ